MQVFDEQARKQARIEKLAGLFRSPLVEVHKVAAWALSVIGEPAVPGLLEAIPSGKESLHESAIDEISWALLVIGKPAIPYLKAAVDGDGTSRAEVAARILAEIEDSDSSMQKEENAPGEALAKAPGMPTAESDSQGFLGF